MLFAQLGRSATDLPAALCFRICRVLWVAVRLSGPLPRCARRMAQRSRSDQRATSTCAGGMYSVGHRLAGHAENPLRIFCSLLASLLRIVWVPFTYRTPALTALWLIWPETPPLSKVKIFCSLNTWPLVLKGVRETYQIHFPHVNVMGDYVLNDILAPPLLWIILQGTVLQNNAASR